MTLFTVTCPYCNAQLGKLESIPRGELKCPNRRCEATVPLSMVHIKR